MPRIYASNNDPYDFCQKHFPTTEEEVKRFHDMGYGPDGRGDCFDYDAFHPDYEECGDYKCYECGRTLTNGDDYAGC